MAFQQVKKVINLPDLHTKQQEIEDDPHRFRVISCGRRWGKTFLATRGLFRLMQERYVLQKKAQRMWVIAPTFPLVREDWISAEEILRDAITAKKQTEMKMEFKPFGYFEFKSAERDDEGLRGAGLDGAVVDEASRVSRKAWEQGIRPSLADKQGRCIFISTPKGRNWFYELWLQGQGGSEDIKSWKYETHTNPFFPKEEWKKIYESTPEMVLKQEYLADFLEDEASVFKNIERCYRGAMEGPKTGEKYSFGVDLGKAEDFTVITGIKESSCQVVYVKKINKVDWSIQKNIIKSTASLYPNSIFHIDSSGLGDPIEEDLRQSGINTRSFKFTNTSKEELVEQLIVAIEQGLVGLPICKETEFLINELKAFTYEILASGKIKYSAPEGLHDDGVMSLGLAIHGMSHMFYRKTLRSQAEPPRNSAAWLEKQMYQKEVENNMRLPRRLRRQIPALSFS